MQNQRQYEVSYYNDGVIVMYFFVQFLIVYMTKWVSILTDFVIFIVYKVSFLESRLYLLSGVVQWQLGFRFFFF